jgi:hypothetical protein
MPYRPRNLIMSSTIHTYNGKGTVGREEDAKHHAQAYTGAVAPLLLPGEKKLSYGPIKIVLTKKYGEGLHSASRICCSRIYTLEHNVPVCPMGEVDKRDFERLQEYYITSVVTVIKEIQMVNDNNDDEDDDDDDDDDEDDDDDDEDDGNLANYSGSSFMPTQNVANMRSSKGRKDYGNDDYDTDEEDEDDGAKEYHRDSKPESKSYTERKSTSGRSDRKGGLDGSSFRHGDPRSNRDRRDRRDGDGAKKSGPSKRFR